VIWTEQVGGRFYQRSRDQTPGGKNPAVGENFSGDPQKCEMTVCLFFDYV
jgi:hypothetical protein